MESGRNKIRKQGNWEEMCKELRMLVIKMLGRELNGKNLGKKDTIRKKERWLEKARREGGKHASEDKTKLAITQSSKEN